MEHKKKRGRKPKNKIIVNENPQFEQDKIDNLISSLNVNKEQLDVIDIQPNDISEEGQMEIETIDKSLCWNCSHNIDVNISYPINYINNIFHLNGNFCSYECAGRYIFDNYHGKDLFNKYTLLNLFYNKNHNTCKKVKIAPEKISLKKFGGKLDYSEYINSSSTFSIQNSYIPPSIYIDHQFYKKQSKESKSFKMYRKNDLKTNSIFKDIEQVEKNLIY